MVDRIARWLRDEEAASQFGPLCPCRRTLTEIQYYSSAASDAVKPRRRIRVSCDSLLLGRLPLVTPRSLRADS